MYKYIIRVTKDMGDSVFDTAHDAEEQAETLRKWFPANIYEVMRVEMD